MYFCGLGGTDRGDADESAWEALVLAFFAPSFSGSCHRRVVKNNNGSLTEGWSQSCQ